tara:strand:+ start:1464 stop:1607 length:144 start_codon:yes stop_codon:yes gene_type:complete
LCAAESSAAAEPLVRATSEEMADAEMSDAAAPAAAPAAATETVRSAA